MQFAFWQIVIGNESKAPTASAYAFIHCVFSKFIESFSVSASGTRFSQTPFL